MQLEDANRTDGVIIDPVDPNWFYDDPTGQVWSQSWDPPE